MASAIDATKPVAGNALTAAERANWATAKAEISALQATYAPLASPHFTGVPTAPQPANGDNSNQIATTNFVVGAVVAATAGVATFNSRSGAVVLTTADVTNAGGVAAANGALTGNPTAPTQATADSSTRIATTALVAAKITAANVPAPSGTNPQMDGAASAGAATTYSRSDHRHPTDTSRAPVDSPSFTNNATVGGNLFCSGTLYINPANSWEWAQYRESSSGDHIQIHRSGWYDRWASSGGTRTWVVNNAVGMSLDANGTLTANALRLSGTASLTMDASYTYFAQDAANWQWRYRRSDGRMSWLRGSDGAELFAIDPAGNASVPGNFAAGSSQIVGTGAQRGLIFATGWAWTWDGATGNLIYTTPAGGFWNMRTSDWFAFNNIGSVGGVGAYVNLSDARSKQNIRDVAYGIDQIRELRPRSFQRIGSPRTELGFIAQEVQPVIPEAVPVAGIPLPDGSGGPDSPSPSLGLNADALLAVAIAAIKTLDARIAALEAQLAGGSA